MANAVPGGYVAAGTALFDEGERTPALAQPNVPVVRLTRTP